SFLGFFPADKPKYVGLIVFDEPGGEAHTGGGIAAPVFREVVESIIPIVERSEKALVYRLQNQKNKIFKVDPKQMPDMTGLTASEVIQVLKQLKVKYTLDGSGFVKSQDPKPNTSITPNITVKIILEP
ncbi:PASTA domain-containing protein, partial [Leptospira levettii]